MEVPSSEALIRQVQSEPLIKPVPKPFSIEALISDTVPRRAPPAGPTTWCGTQAFLHRQHLQITRDTDSEGSTDLDLAQDLSRHSQRDGELLKKKKKDGFEVIRSKVARFSRCNGNYGWTSTKKKKIFKNSSY